MRAHTTLACLALLAVLAAAAAASDIAERHHSFDASGVGRLSVENGVGEILLVPSDGDTIDVELRLEPQQNGGWFRRSADVSDMDLQARARGDRLTLSFKEKNVKSEWVIHVPASLNVLSINAGVGEVHGSVPPLAATFEVGVGGVRIEAERAAVGTIELSAGVGDTRITGATQSDGRRAFVSSTSSGRGDGEDALRVSVGVGDAQVALR